MKEEKYIIWSDDPIRQEPFEEYKKRIAEDCPELIDDASDHELMLRQAEEIDLWLDDERANLNICLGHPILAIGDLGRWNGRVPGYKLLPSGNIRDCLQSCTDSMSYDTFYVTKQGEFKLDEHHHDGTNYVTYRVLRPGVTESQLNDLLTDICCGTATSQKIERLTRRIGPDIAKVYGWQLDFGRTKARRATPQHPER